MIGDESPPPLPRERARFGDRRLFPSLAHDVYLNHAAISPPSTRVLAMMQAAMADYGREGVGAVGPWLAQRARLRNRIARLIGADTEDVGFVPNTSAGITAIARCFPWEAGDRVVVFRGEFPSNVTPWQRAAQSFDLTLESLDIEDLAQPGEPNWDPLDAVLERGVRLVAISAVQFQTGLRVPMEPFYRRCKAAGAQVFVDGIQAVGGVPVDTRFMDYLACGGHKWLMGPEGTGFLYVAPEHIDALRPNLASWLSHEDALDFLFEPGKLRYDKPIRKRIDFLEGGAPNTIGMAGWEAAIEHIEQLGVLSIYAHISRWINALEPALVERGFTSLRSLDPKRRSGILSVEPSGKRTAGDWALELGDQGVACSTPDGKLRFAPHWPNHLDEVERVIEAVDQILGR